MKKTNVCEQGQKAVKTGLVHEAIIKAPFVSRGYPVVKYKDYIKNPCYSEALLTQVPYIGPYEGTRPKAEYMFISSAKNITVWIDCRWQQSSGSVDEKYMYLIACANLRSEPTIIVYGGKGARQGAVKWLRSQASDKIAIMTGEEFQIWFNNNL